MRRLLACPALRQMRRALVCVLLALALLPGCASKGASSKAARPEAPKPLRRPIAIVLAQPAGEGVGNGAIWRVSLEGTSADYALGVTRWALGPDGRSLLIDRANAEPLFGRTEGLGLFDTVRGGRWPSVSASTPAAFGWDVDGTVVALTGKQGVVHGGYTLYPYVYNDLVLWRGSPSSLTSEALIYGPGHIGGPIEFLAADGAQAFFLTNRRFVSVCDVGTARLSVVGSFPQLIGPPPAPGTTFERPLLQRPGSAEEGAALLRYGLPVEVDENRGVPGGGGIAVFATPKALKVVRLQDLSEVRSVAVSPEPRVGEARTFVFDDTRSRCLESVEPSRGVRGIAELELRSGTATMLVAPGPSVREPLGYVGSGGDFAYLASGTVEPEVRLFERRGGRERPLATLHYAVAKRPVVFLGVEYDR